MAEVRRQGRDHVVGGEKPSAFRCLDAARYVVSAVVVVLIVAVAAKAIMVVLRPDKLALSVPGSCVYTGRSADRKWLDFFFHLRAENPSGRARMYYLNVTAYLFDNTTKPATESSSLSDDSLIFFEMGDIAVPQMQYVDKIKESPNISRDPNYIMVPFFDELNSRAGATIHDATMRVEGILVTETSSGHNTTPQATTYYCRQLIVGLDPKDQASTSSQATSCTTL